MIAATNSQWPVFYLQKGNFTPGRLETKKMKHSHLAVLLLLLLVTAAGAQDKLPVIKSNVSVISIQDGKQLKKNFWTLAPEAKPDVYEAELINGKPHKVTFITDLDSCHTQIVGRRYIPAAVFDKNIL
jgi:hypothetical protein